MNCPHTTQRIQPGVTYHGVASVFECPWCKCDSLAADLASCQAALRKIVAYPVGEMRKLTDEIAIWNIAREALTQREPQ